MKCNCNLAKQNRKILWENK